MAGGAAPLGCRLSVGIGDEIMGSGMARGAAARGRRTAFGDGRRIIWGPHCAEIYRNNPNVAPPGSEGAKDLEWRRYYSGSRGYVKGTKADHKAGRRFVFDASFRPPRGEFFFDEAERSWASAFGTGFVIVDGYLPPKGQSMNKKWHGWSEVAAALQEAGRDVRQFQRPVETTLPVRGARPMATPTFRHAAALLASAALYIGPEGGLHHAAAAVNIPAVVLFGGFIHPKTTGYDGHVNIFTGGAACGSLQPCDHCRDAMAKITAAQVLESAEGLLARPA